MAEADPSHASSLTLRQLFAREKWACIFVAAASLAVVVGVYAVGVARADHRSAALAALAAGTLWVVLASGALAAGGRYWLSALLRGGIAADALGVGLLVIWLWQKAAGHEQYLTFAGAVKVYVVYAAVCLAAIAAVRLARTPAGRYALAAAVAGVMLASLASPFLVNGLLASADAEHRRQIMAVAIAANPFYSVTAAVVDQTMLVWHQAPVLYNYTRIGEYYGPGEISWFRGVLTYLGAALVLTVLAAVRNRSKGEAPPSASTPA